MDEKLQDIDGFFDEVNSPILQKFLNENFGVDKYPAYKGEEISFSQPSKLVIKYRGLTFTTDKDSHEGDGTSLEIYPEIAYFTYVIAEKDINVDLTEHLYERYKFATEVVAHMAKYFSIGRLTKQQLEISYNHLLLSCLRDRIIDEHFCFINESSNLELPYYDTDIEITFNVQDNVKVHYSAGGRKIRISLNFFRTDLHQIIEEIVSSSDFKSVMESLKLSSLFEEERYYDAAYDDYFGRYVHHEMNKDKDPGPIYKSISKQLKEKLNKNELVLLANSTFQHFIYSKTNPDSGEFIEIPEFKWIEIQGNTKIYAVVAVKTTEFACYFKDRGVIEVIRKNDKHPFMSI